MGTPEFPHLGKHCSVEDCHLIDFLPFTCDQCDKVFCLEHRSYGKHSCPKANFQNVTVVICPLCAKGVRLFPTEDPNITWESHVNTECDPSNYERATKKKKCPVPRCRESLTFSNTIRCRDCSIDHCLKHRFGPDHNCPGPKKSDTASGFPFISLLNRSQKDKRSSNQNHTSSSPTWGTSFLKAASSFRASAEASMTKLSNATSQALNMSRDGGQSSNGSNGSSNGGVEECPQCGLKFSSVTSLVEHVEKVHEAGSGRDGVLKVTLDVCPKCSKGFRDPVALVEHVEREHRGSNRQVIHPSVVFVWFVADFSPDLSFIASHYLCGNQDVSDPTLFPFVPLSLMERVDSISYLKTASANIDHDYTMLGG